MPKATPSDVGECGDELGEEKTKTGGIFALVRGHHGKAPMDALFLKILAPGHARRRKSVLHAKDARTKNVPRSALAEPSFQRGLSQLAESHVIGPY